MDSSTRQPSRIFYGYFVALALIVICAVPVSFALSCAGIFFTPIAQSLNSTPGTISYYVAIMSIASFVCLPSLGRAFAKFDARVITSVAVIVVAGTFLCLSLVQDVLQFFICSAVMGVGFAPLMYLAPSVLINRWFAKKAGVLIGVVMAFTGVGGAIWNTVGGILINACGWRFTYLFFAIATLVLTLPFTLFIIRSKPEDKGLRALGSDEADPEDATQAPIGQAEGITMKEAWKSPSFSLLLVYAALLNLCMIIGSMLPSYVATLPISRSMPLLGATVSSVLMVSQIIAKLAWGAIGDRKTIPCIVAGCLFGIGGIAVAALLSQWWIAICVAAVLIGFYYALTNVMNPIVTRKFFGLREYSVIYSKVTTAATVGMAGGTFLWGGLLNLTGSYNVMFIGGSIMLVVTIAAIVLAGILNARERESGR